MPIPLIIAGAAVYMGAKGVKKGKASSSTNDQAKYILRNAENLYNRAQCDLETQKRNTTEALNSLGETKLEVWGSHMQTFVNDFKTFKNIDLDSNYGFNEVSKLKIKPVSFKKMEVATTNANEILSAGVTALGAGALAGIASYGGAMMFASASTGTAISRLSGAAKSNATLAWFGGGSLATGGLGKAGGKLVLGGIVAGSALAVAGSILEAKSKANLSRAEAIYSEAIEAAGKFKTMQDALCHIENIAHQYDEFICDFSDKFDSILDKLEDIKYNHSDSEQKSLFGLRKAKIDFDELTRKEQETLHLSWLMAQVLNSVLSAPILEENGELDSEAQSVLADSKNSAYALLEEKNKTKHRPSRNSKVSNINEREDAYYGNHDFYENQQITSYNNQSRYTSNEILDVDFEEHSEQPVEDYTSFSGYNLIMEEIPSAPMTDDFSKNRFDNNEYNEMVESVKETGKKVYKQGLKWFRESSTMNALSEKAKKIADGLMEEMSDYSLSEEESPIESTNSVDTHEEILVESITPIPSIPTESSELPIEKQIELIKQLKGLLEDGILSKEEFEAKKKEILNIKD